MRACLQTLAQQMQITEQDISQRKELLNFTASDIACLTACSDWIAPLIPNIVSELYLQQTQIDEIANLIGDQQTLINLHSAMTRYITELFSGDYGMNYVEKRLRIGKVHQRIGVSSKLYLSGVHMLQNLLISDIHEYFTRHKQSPAKTTNALRKLFYFDNQLVFDTYVSSMQNELEEVNQQLNECSENLEKTIHDRTHQLVELSMRDSLTGLYNQRAFYQEANKVFELCQRTDLHFSLLYIDFNKFKQVNDHHGHRIGDQVIKAFANACRDSLRKTETTARFGGDEFVILLPNTPIENAEIVCRRLTSEFERQLDVDVSLSIGGASYFPGSSLNLDTIIQLADRQMYIAKKAAHISDTSEFRFMLRDSGSHNDAGLKKHNTRH